MATHGWFTAYNENGLTCDFIAASRMPEAVFDDIDEMGGDLG